MTITRPQPQQDNTLHARQSYFTLPTLLELDHGNRWQIITACDQNGTERLVSIEFCPPKILPQRFPQGTFERFVAEKLTAYLAGECVDFSDIPLLINEGAPFHQKVWQALRTIGYGETRTYSDVAEMAGSPGAQRAVGQAVGRNPIPVIIPCHRVVASDGSPGGFMRGHPEGGQIKQFLLKLEQAGQ